MQQRAVRVELVEVEVVHAAVALGVGALVGVARRPARRAPGAAPRWSAWAWPSTTRVMPAQLRAGGGERVRHRLDAGVEREHAVAVAHEVDVHRLAREAAAHDPDAVGDRLRLAAAAGARAACAALKARRHPRARPASPRGGSSAELARDASCRRRRRRCRRPARRATVTTSQPSSVERRAGRPRGPGSGRPGERAGHPPAHGAAVVLGGRLEAPRTRVRDRGEQLAEALRARRRARRGRPGRAGGRAPPGASRRPSPRRRARRRRRSSAGATARLAACRARRRLRSTSASCPSSSGASPVARLTPQLARL